MTRIPVDATVLEAVRFLGKNWARFLSLGWLTLVLQCLVDQAAELVLPADEENPGDLAFTLSMALLLLSGMIAVPFFVAWHRLTLDLPIRSGAFGFPIPGRRGWRYLGWTVLFYVPTAIILIPAWQLGDRPATEGPTGPELLAVAVILVVVAAWAWLLFRLAFLFVDIAIDTTGGVAVSWAANKGHTGRLLAVGVLCFAPATAVEVLTWVGAVPLSELEPLWIAINSVLYFITVTLWVSASTIAYRTVRQASLNAVADVF